MFSRHSIRLLVTAVLAASSSLASVAWAQQPFMARTGCIRYVATAMNARQAKTSG